jgi:glycosyltransferase involved in cell wall biosynthesis
MKVSALMPAYNEEATIAEVVSQVLKLDFIDELIVVDDSSRDKTYQILKEFSDPKIKLIRHTYNQGKTAAINTALNHATGDISVIQDADLEYDPNELKDVLQPILEEKADVVYGSRFMVKKASRVLYFYHYLANKFLTFLSNIFTNVNMSDIETC